RDIKSEAEKEKILNSPVEFIWDTQAPILDDPTLPADDRIARDGPHVIDVYTHKRDGAEAEHTAVQVTLKNQIDSPGAKLLPLWYSGKVGRQYVVEHNVNVTAVGTDTNYGYAQSNAGGLNFAETTRFLVSCEDFSSKSGSTFWRERRESPITVLLNGVK